MVMIVCLNDINPQVINVLGSTDYVHVQNRVNVLKTYDHDSLQEQYYIARDVINKPEQSTPLVRAISYIIVRQLCFQWNGEI